MSWHAQKRATRAFRCVGGALLPGGVREDYCLLCTQREVSLRSLPVSGADFPALRALLLLLGAGGRPSGALLLLLLLLLRRRSIADRVLGRDGPQSRVGGGRAKAGLQSRGAACACAWRVRARPSLSQAQERWRERSRSQRQRARSARGCAGASGASGGGCRDACATRQRSRVAPARDHTLGRSSRAGAQAQRRERRRLLGRYPAWPASLSRGGCYA